jgi:cytochrome c-type biogenesis protein CcmH/NrfG
VEQLKNYQRQNAERSQAMGEVDSMENMARTNPGNIQNLIRLGGTYLAMQQTNRGYDILNQAINSSNIAYPDATLVAQYFGQLGNIPGFENALEKMVVLAPNEPEPRFHLAEVMAVTGRTADALQDLQQAIALSRKKNEGDTMVTQALADPNFRSLRSLPYFQKIVSPN